MSRLLVIDDDPAILSTVNLLLSRQGFQCTLASSGEEALVYFEDLSGFQAVVLDLDLPGVSGVELLAKFKATLPQLPVVVFTATEDLEVVVECMTLGAADYVTKPFASSRLVTSVENACERGRLAKRLDSLSKVLGRDQGLEALLGTLPLLLAAKELLARAAPSEVTLLLSGESGTGKEVAARAVHFESERRTGPLVTINCGAIPAGLAESELFGHEKGAFTGADQARAGCFERADAGTIFLDEVGELEPSAQVKLLRVLQERTVQRVGGSGERRVDLRVIAATNRDLKACVAEGTFREDLYFRLAVFPVRLPPLRERDGDVELLVRRFLKEFCQRHGRMDALGVSEGALRALVAYPWPGNVRELQNAIERAVILEQSDQITLGSLPEGVVCGLDALAPEEPSSSISTPPTDEIVPLAQMERLAIESALRTTGGNLKLAASRLGIGRATMYRKLQRHGLERGSPH